MRHVPPKRRLAFNGLQQIELFKERDVPPGEIIPEIYQFYYYMHGFKSMSTSFPIISSKGKALRP
jgi:hypothetical protein